jgi:hypothetical protein
MYGPRGDKSIMVDDGHVAPIDISDVLIAASPAGPFPPRDEAIARM